MIRADKAGAAAEAYQRETALKQRLDSVQVAVAPPRRTLDPSGHSRTFPRTRTAAQAHARAHTHSRTRTRIAHTHTHSTRTLVARMRTRI